MGNDKVLVAGSGPGKSREEGSHPPRKKIATFWSKPPNSPVTLAVHKTGWMYAASDGPRTSGCGGSYSIARAMSVFISSSPSPTMFYRDKLLARQKLGITQDQIDARIVFLVLPEDIKVQSSTKERVVSLVNQCNMNKGYNINALLLKEYLHEGW